MDFDFNSYANVHGVQVAAGADGFFQLFANALDGSTAISASFTLARTDFGSINPKRMAYLYIGYEADGDLQVTAWANEVLVGVYDIPAGKTGQQRHRVKLGEGAYGEYWEFKFSNVDGADFSIDHVEVVPIIMNHGHG